MKFIIDNYTNNPTIIETKQLNNYRNKSKNLTWWQVTYPKSITGTPKQDVK